MNVTEFITDSSLVAENRNTNSVVGIGGIMMIDSVFSHNNCRKNSSCSSDSSDTSESSGSSSSSDSSGSSDTGYNSSFAKYSYNNNNTNNTSLKQMLEEAEQQRTLQQLQDCIEQERERHFDLKQWLMENVKCHQCGKTYRRDECLVRHIKNYKYEICCRDLPHKEIIKSQEDAQKIYDRIVENANKNVSIFNKMNATVPHTNLQCHKCFKRTRKSCVIL